MHTNRIINGIVIAVAKLASVLGFFLLNLLFASQLNIETYGEYTLAVGVMFFVGPLVALGTSEQILRKVSVFSRNGQRVLADKIYIRGLMLCAVASILIWLVFLLMWLTDIVQNSFLLILFCAPVVALVSIASAYSRGNGKIVQSQLFETLFRILVCALAFAIWFIAEITPSLIILIFLVSAVATVTVIGFLSFHFTQCRINIFAKPKAYFLILRNGAPFILISIMQGLKNYGDLFVVGFFLGSGSAGVYSIAVQIVLVISFLQMILSILLSRQIAWELKHNNIVMLRKLYRANIFFSVPFGVVYIVLVFMYGDRVVNGLIGSDYQGSLLIAYILGAGRIVHMSVGPVMQILTLSNNQDVAARITVINGVMNILLSIILVQFLGIIGAAIAGAVSISVWALMLRGEVKKIYPGMLNIFG